MRLSPVKSYGVLVGHCKRAENEPFSSFRGRLIRTIHVKHNGQIRLKKSIIRFKDGAYQVRNKWHATHLPGFVPCR